MVPSGALALPRDIQPIRAIFADCCALAASGQLTAAPARTVTKSRRLMPPPALFSAGNYAVPSLDPIAEHSLILFYDLVRAGEDRWRHGKVERLGGFEIDDQLECGRLLDR